MLPKIADWLFQRMEPISQFLDQVGWKEPIKKQIKRAWRWGLTMLSASAGTAYTLWLWAWSYVPHWAAPLVWFAVTSLALTAMLGIAYLCVSLFDRYLAMRSRLDFDPRKFRELGEQMLELHRDIAVFITDATRDKGPDDWNDSGRAEAIKFHEERIHKGRITAAKFAEKFAPRMQRYFILCRHLGIPLPWPLTIHSDHDIHGVANYFGLVGSLLANDQLDVAKGLTRDTLWQIRN